MQGYIKDITNAKEDHEKQLFNNKKNMEEMLDKKQAEYEKKVILIKELLLLS